jgi:hypothetical protein
MPTTNRIISTKDWIISENEFWDFGEGSPRTSSIPNVETVMLQTSTHTQTQARPMPLGRVQSPMVGIVTPQSERSDQSEHPSAAPSSPASMSPEGSVQAETRA